MSKWGRIGVSNSRQAEERVESGTSELEVAAIQIQKCGRLGTVPVCDDNLTRLQQERGAI